MDNGIHYYIDITYRNDIIFSFNFYIFILHPAHKLFQLNILASVYSSVPSYLFLWLHYDIQSKSWEIFPLLL